MSIASATASNSSSQSSRLSWHPSHEANFHTASRGLFFLLTILNLIQPEQAAQLIITKHRPVLADKVRAELTMTAEADGAFHVALHRKINRIPRNAHIA